MHKHIQPKSELSTRYLVEWADSKVRSQTRVESDIPLITWHFVSGFEDGTFLEFTAVWDWWRPTVISYCPHFLLFENTLQGLRNTTVSLEHEGCDCQCFNRYVCAECFSKQSHPPAWLHPSQEPHLDATCAQDLGGLEPGPKTAQGDIFCKAGIAGLTWLLVNHF